MPAGKVSASPAVSVAAVGLTLPSVRVNVEVPPDAMVAGANALVIVGASGLTVRVALAAPALLPSLVCKAPAATVLVAAPMVLDVTDTEIVQPPEGIEAPFA